MDAFLTLQGWIKQARKAEGRLDEIQKVISSDISDTEKVALIRQLFLKEYETKMFEFVNYK